MTDAKKFMFDTNDFNKQTKSRADVYTEEQLLLAKDQAFALGRSEGLLEAKQQQEERIAEMLKKTMALAEKLSQNEGQRDIEKFMDTVKLGMQVVRKLLPKFASQCALQEIENVIVQEVGIRKDEPRIAVTIPTVHLEALKSRIDGIALEKGYAGKVILLTDDALPPTDCRVEWADGGAERIYERLSSQIETEFTKAISGINATLEQNKK